MAQLSCSCGFKDQMITEMISVRKQFPGKESNWVDLLFPVVEDVADQSLCCLLTYLFYYGYWRR